MIKKIHVSAFLKHLGQGVSVPALVLSDDNQRYILKNQKTVIDGHQIDFNCSFLNEILAYQIAKYLDIPVPEAAIAELDKRILDNGPSLRFVHRFTEGTLFASKELQETEENLLENYELLIEMQKPYISRSWKKFYSDICNPHDSANIIAFDLLIANIDRYENTGNLLIAQGEAGRQMYAIDHGHSFFGPVWHTEKMGKLKAAEVSQAYFESYLSDIRYFPNRGYLNGLGEVFKAMEANIDLNDVNNHSFLTVVEKIENINENLLDEWLFNVPDVWFVDKTNQIALYKHFLLNQKVMIRNFLQHMANFKAFTNFRGGNLQWIEKPTGTV